MIVVVMSGIVTVMGEERDLRLKRNVAVFLCCGKMGFDAKFNNPSLRLWCAIETGMLLSQFLFNILGKSVDCEMK